jgi:uncharacterized protein (DUF2062 family)
LPPLSPARFFARAVERARSLWFLALRERATPAGIGWAIATGVFAGCTPFVGFHAGIAIVLATVLRLNRIWAIVGSRVSFFLILPWIAFAEIQAGHRLRSGAWAPLPTADVLAHAREWFEDWCIGTLPVGAALAATLGGLAYALARGRERRRARP